MSTFSTTTKVGSTSRSVLNSVYATETPEGVGATVRRSIGTAALRNLSPFLMLDDATVRPGAGFPDHPHRGMTTVSYVLDGKIQHEDSTGNAGVLETGDVQWMTAGRGIMHSEMPLFDPDPAKARPMRGLQLWVDLPKDQKYMAPSYQERKASDIDTVRPADGVQVTVISGTSHGIEGFVRSVGGSWFIDTKLQKAGASITHDLPAGWTAFAYIISGSLTVGDDPKVHSKYHTLVLSSKAGETSVTLHRPEDGPDEEARFVLVAGQPLDQPVVQYGPFVVNTQREAMQAVMDFREGKNGFENAPGWQSKAGATLRA